MIFNEYLKKYENKLVWIYINLVGLDLPESGKPMKPTGPPIFYFISYLVNRIYTKLKFYLKVKRIKFIFKYVF